MMNAKKIIFIFPFFLFLTSCVKPYTQAKQINCMKNIYECISSEPKKFIQDTNYVVLPVRTNDTNSNHFAISFTPNNDILLTAGSISSQNIYKAKLITYDSIYILNQYNTKNNIQITFPISLADTLIVACANSEINSNTSAKDTIVNSSIYSAKIQNDSILINHKLIATENSEWISYPAISENSKRIFFSYSKFDEYQEQTSSDVYYVNLDNSEWEKAQKVQGKMNTYCDEFVSTTKNDKIFFSSRANQNFGGYDIFIYDNKLDSNPININNYLNLEINTESDEMGFIYFEKGVYYFCRNVNGKMKLYVALPKNKLQTQFQIKNIVDNKDSNHSKNIRIKGQVFSKTTNKIITNANIIIENYDSKKIDTITCNSYGEYNIIIPNRGEIRMSAHSNTFFFDDTIINLPFINDSLNYDFYLSNIAVIRLNFPANIFDKPYKYALDANGLETEIDYKNELNYFANDLNLYASQIKKIIITGHTDTNNTEKYNKILAYKRAEFVKSILVSKGIPNQKIEVRSRGEVDNLIRNHGESIELWRKRCRRVVIEKELK